MDALPVRHDDVHGPHGSVHLALGAYLDADGPAEPRQQRPPVVDKLLALLGAARHQHVVALQQVSPLLHLVGVDPALEGLAEKQDGLVVLRSFRLLLPDNSPESHWQEVVLHVLLLLEKNRVKHPSVADARVPVGYRHEEGHCLAGPVTH